MCSSRLSKSTHKKKSLHPSYPIMCGNQKWNQLPHDWQPDFKFLVTKLGDQKISIANFWSP